VRWVSDLARAHTRRLVAVARREGLGPEDALDAVQEAFYTFLVLPQA
jgi:RNA polymerase sigma-70 factor, ECF subfamily